MVKEEKPMGTRDDIQLLDLKRLLSDEIQKEVSDYNTILSLSSQIAQHDEGNVRFSVDAGIINRLGRELVGRQETAVSELVKNAYDADATRVTLSFEKAKEIGGTLYIDDDGLGMTRDQLINGFMRLSSADKINNPVSERYKRTRAGKKGIGRFATQRLGTVLTIITQTDQASSALKITINWNEFESDKDLLSIANKIEEVEKQKVEGTTLIISFLRESWSDSMIKRVYRYTADLLQPFPLSKLRKEEEERRVDPGFRSHYFRRENGSDTPIIDEQTAFYDQALAQIEGYVLDNGQGCWEIKSDKLEFSDVFLIGKNRDNDQEPFKFIKDVHFRTYYFIYDPSLLPPQQLSFIRGVANEKGGIRIYRNGFRVLPYGERLNDWLGLDESTAKRVILSSHRNINFFGFVEITDKSGILFDETSSREGLFENEAFNELVDFVQRAIISAVLKVSELRGRKGSTGQLDWSKPSSSGQVDDAISELDNLFGANEKNSEDWQESSRYREAFERLKNNREQEKIELVEERNRLILEINMLRVLAGLGLVIGEFVHEVKRFLPAFDADIVHLKDILRDVHDAYRRVERLGTNLNSFTAYTAYFDKAISQNVSREIKPLDLIDIVNDFEDVISADVKRSSIDFLKPIFKEFDLYTTPMHPSEWASLLFNLYTNSKKAIRRKQVPGKIQIECGREGNSVYMAFSDNGDGIPSEKEEVIFNAFYTTSSAVGNLASDSETLTGTGLGLKIVKDIVESYGGEIFVSTPSPEFNTTLRILIPQNGK